MSDVIIGDVHVREHRGRRVTTITIVEGRGGDVWPARATTVPPIVRDQLTAWLRDVPACSHQDDGGGVHVTAVAETTLTVDAPAVAVRLGFTPDRP